LGLIIFFIIFLIQHKTTKLKKKKDPKHIGPKKSALAHGPSSPACVLVLSFIIFFNFLTVVACPNFFLKYDGNQRVIYFV